MPVDPNDKYTLDRKGVTLDNLANYTKAAQYYDKQAIQYFDKALAIDPKYEDALVNKGLALSRVGNYTQSKQFYEKA